MARYTYNVLNPSRYGDLLGVCGPAIDAGSLIKDLDWIRTLGVRLVRADVSWPQCETSAGVYNFTDAVRWAQEVVKRGMVPVPILGYCPTFYAQTQDDLSVDATHYLPTMDKIERYTDFIKAAAKALSDVGVDIIEGWNEWNLYGFTGPAADADTIAKMQSAMAHAWREIDPRVIVLSGATAPAVTDVTSLSAVDALAAFKANGGSPASYQGWAHHPYCYPQDPMDPANITQPWNAFTTQTTSLASALSMQGRKQRVWATEIGWPTSGSSGLSEADAAARLTADLTTWIGWVRLGRTGPAIIFNHQDSAPYGDTDSTKYLGLRRYDGTEKPMVASLRTLANTSISGLRLT